MQIWSKFTHLPQKEIFWEISFTSLLSTYGVLTWCKVAKTSLEQILRNSINYKILQTHRQTPREKQTYENRFSDLESTNIKCDEHDQHE